MCVPEHRPSPVVANRVVYPMPDQRNRWKAPYDEQDRPSEARAALDDDDLTLDYFLFKHSFPRCRTLLSASPILPLSEGLLVSHCRPRQSLRFLRLQSLRLSTL